MRLLLDTHALMWAFAAPDRLSSEALGAVADRANTVVVSVVSQWEMSIKASVGKLDVAFDVRRALPALGADELLVTGDHARAVGELPLHHRDPFDRMRVAQARYEGLTLVTADRRLEAYPVALLRAD